MQYIIQNNKKSLKSYSRNAIGVEKSYNKEAILLI